MMAAGAIRGGMMFGGVPLFGQQTTIPEGGPPYVPMGGVQVGPDGVNANPPPGQIGAGAPQQGAAPGGGRGVAAGGAAGGGRGGRGRGGGAARPARPQPAGIFWIAGTGAERQPPDFPWDLKLHTQKAMDNVKRGIEARGGTMDSFLFMQVFFCLHLDDAKPMPKGGAAANAYQQAYLDMLSVYNTYWPNGAPPGSLIALPWISGHNHSLFEAEGAAYLDPSTAPPPST
jgi:hypothetical protein